MAAPRALVRPVLTAALAAALSLAGVAAVGSPPATAAADPVAGAMAHLSDDAHGALTMRRDADGALHFVGVPADADVDHPGVTPDTSVDAAAAAALDRYGPALGSAVEGSSFERTATRRTPSGDVVRYQQSVAGVPVLGGQVVVSLRPDRELSSMLASTSERTHVADATVSEAAASDTARAAFVRRNGAGGDVQVASDGRWLLDAGLIGGDASQPDRTVWRLHVSRGVGERRQLLVDDRTGAVLMDTDEIEHADRVVCDDANVPQSSDVPCTSGFARVEGGAASAVADVNTAYDLSGVVSDFYQQIEGVDLTDLLGISVGGVKKLASTTRWCYTGASCPYANAFWNGSQMYYGTGYAGADDVVGHEMTHGFTERNSGLFYWGQSGAMNESMSDIIGEIIDHRHPSTGDSPTSWALGEDIPGFPAGIRNLQDPTLFNDPDKTSSTLYVQEGKNYPDEDGVHTNSGVGNHTAYLISQGGTFNGQTITGIDTGDAGLTKSARLWLLVDQSLTSGSDYADEGTVLDQSCQALLSGGADGFTAADCANVHKATLATELARTPTNNPQPADATATCASGTKRVLLDSETGAPATKFVAGSTWARSTEIAHSGPTSWLSTDPASIGASSLAAASGIALPAGQPSYLIFERWHVLDWDTLGFYDGLTVEVDDTGDAAGPVDASSLPWVNGPTSTIASGFGNPAAGRQGFGGDSRGYVASRLDLSSYAGKTVKPQFTMNTDNSIGYPGLALDDVVVYTCDPVVLVNNAPPGISGLARVGGSLTASPGGWTPSTSDVTFAYRWLRSGAPIAGATTAHYAPLAADAGQLLTVRVTASRSGSAPVTVDSPTGVTVQRGLLRAGRPSVAGTARVGSRLTAKPGTWAPAPVRLSYAWLRNGKAIRGARAAKYTLTRADQGARISVKVTGTKAGYSTASATSRATGKVKPKKR